MNTEVMSDKLCRNGLQPLGVSVNKSAPHLCRHQPSEVPMLLLPPSPLTRALFSRPFADLAIKAPQGNDLEPEPRSHAWGPSYSSGVRGWARLGALDWAPNPEPPLGSLGIIWGLKDPDEEFEKLGNHF